MSERCNDIQTWRQVKFIDKYRDMSERDKETNRNRESHLVRPSPTGNAICQCSDPSDAKWIAQRLNLASQLEQMTYDFATGKTDGSEIVELVKKHVS